MKHKNNSDIIKDVRALLNQIMMIQRKAKDQNLWIGAGVDPYRPLTDEAQQGPLVTKLFEMTKALRKTLNKR